jgi:glyoxylase-like metal-dependent hydrolase (beta-lactamase superfamily II)
VAYLHQASGVAFTGDVAGVRIAPAGYVLPPTPPPDIDLQAWRDSLAVVGAWGPARLAVTHFGAFDDVDRQLAATTEGLSELCGLAERLEQGDFMAAVRDRVARATDPETAAAYEQAAPPDQLWQGLRRYLQTREQASTGS